MNKMKKMLNNQQEINEAVKDILDYFGSQVHYTVHLENMLEAQTQIIGLMELAKQQAAISDPHEELETESITLFLQEVHGYLNLLKPFAKMLGQCTIQEQE